MSLSLGISQTILFVHSTGQVKPLESDVFTSVDVPLGADILAAWFSAFVPIQVDNFRLCGVFDSQLAGELLFERFVIISHPFALQLPGRM